MNMSNRVVVDSDFRKVIYTSSEKMKGCVEMKNVNIKHCIINVLMLLLLIGILGIIGYLVFSPIYSFLLWRFKTVI